MTNHPMRPSSPFLRAFRLGSMATVLLAGIFLAAPVNAAAVRGRVLYLNNAPAVGVAVRITTPKGVSPFSYSNREGMYYLNAIPAGTYTLEVWQNRKLVTKQTIVVREPTCDVPVTKVP